MALFLPIETQFGISATYHRIAAIDANWADNNGTLTLFSYMNEEARRNNATPAHVTRFQLADICADENSLTRSELYAQVKTQAPFDAAEDA